MKWLITGGAGYIGSHIADLFLAEGDDVVIYDSLYRGSESRVDYLRKNHKKEIPLIIADIRDRNIFSESLQDYNPDGIIHSAALKSVSESFDRSNEYFEVNFEATKDLLALSASHDICNFIFSSTAAVYGSNSHEGSVSEDDVKLPLSPYGLSKLAAEGAVESFLASDGKFGTCLRFFNVVGTAAPELEDDSIENLIPIVLSKLKAGEPPIVFGTNHPTRDGTCIRDYVDVRDIAWAHLKAARANKQLPFNLNVGTGAGTTVLEVINFIRAAGGFFDTPNVYSDPRPGDPASLFADISLIQQSIGFEARYTLEESLQSLF